MAEEITNATEMAEGEEIRSTLVRLAFFKRRNKRKENGWGEARGNSAHAGFKPAIPIFALEFYSPSFSICCFPAPETYCICGKHSRKYGNTSKIILN